VKKGGLSAFSTFLNKNHGKNISRQQFPVFRGLIFAVIMDKPKKSALAEKPATVTKLFVVYLSAFRSSSALSVFSHMKSGSSLPKCPNTADFRYIGLSRRSFSMIALGLMSKCLCINAKISSSDSFPVPNVFTNTETGCATPMAYDN
jgi:hypothetical protein